MPLFPSNRRKFIFNSIKAVTGSMLFSQSFIKLAEAKEQIKPIDPNFKTRFLPEGDKITMVNGKWFGNRPLYGANMASTIMAGDKPLVRYIDRPFAGGSFMIALISAGKSKWLHDFSSVKSSYRAGSMTWELKDVDFPKVSIKMETASLANSSGFAAHVNAEGLSEQDILVWAYGGIMDFKRNEIFWTADPGLHPSVMIKDVDNHQGDTPSGVNDIENPFNPDYCKGNQAEWILNRFKVSNLVNKEDTFAVTGQCSIASQSLVVDGSAFIDPIQLIKSSARELPLICGTVVLKDTKDVYWVVETTKKTLSIMPDPKEAFTAAMQRIDKLAKQVIIKTPDPFINASAPAATAAMDGFYYAPVFVHGAMAWNWPYPGWRSIYGPTTFGWHDRVMKEATYYIASQVKKSDLKTAKSDAGKGMSIQANDSRFYGEGRIVQDQAMYNMQEPLFDQLIHSWRSTGSKELEELLFPALELHLQWLKDCFDPDDDGLYESYINTWGSDSIWYSGGGTGQSTAYAYNGHKAAAEMAERKGDAQAVKRHKAQVEKIKKGVHELLWIPEKGYLAEYVESSKHKRRHDDTSSYTIFLPIDAGMMDEQETVQMLDYTEWGLERIPVKSGGEHCFFSNFVPHVWSVREADTADTLHLALAYYKGGLSEGGWKLFEGAYKESMYNSVVPGGVICEPIGKKYSSTDFADSTSMFSRVLIEGLFGYNPDYPNNVVRFFPQFPSEWPEASIQTPDFSFSFVRKGNDDFYEFTISKQAAFDIKLPVYSTGVLGVEGSSFDWKVIPGYGNPVMRVKSAASKSIKFKVRRKDFKNAQAYVFSDSKENETVSLKSVDGSIVSFSDPQKVLVNAKLVNGKLEGSIKQGAEGRHMVLVLVKSGDVEFWQLFKLNLKKSEKENIIEIPANATWETINIQPNLNGDIREIYKQEYLTPRPNSVSVQLGTDGFSAWTYYFWQIKPPAIDLNNVPKLLDNGQLKTSKGARFTISTDQKNIAFTSLWDNWPDKSTIPVGKSGKAVWFLVAGSTNQMQTGIANGVIRLQYKDGTKAELPLIHPQNYWSIDGLYNYKADAFALPTIPPDTIQLGANCRVMVLSIALKKDAILENITLETLSQEVVIGLMAVSVMS